MKHTKTLIVGAGQVGKALYKVLKDHYNTQIIDRHPRVVGKINIMHICFPYSKNFIKQVKNYQNKYKPNITVIHSSVPVGTSRKCNAVHSPIRGMHPYLAESIKTFTKFVGGEDADKIVEYFRRANIKVYLCRKSETTELAKLLSTTYYATCIEFIKAAENLCREKDVPFAEAFTLFQQTYNNGWEKLDHPEYRRPILIPIQKEEGGHCTTSNAVILHENKSMIPFAEMILEAGVLPQTEKPLEDKVWLYSQYMGKKKSSIEIGRDLGYTDANILRALRRWNIPRRDRSWTEEEIKNIISLYDGGLNFKEISNKVKGRTHNSVRRLAYKKLNLKSKYKPGEETKKYSVRKKISSTLQGISEEEWENFSVSLNEILRRSIEYKKWRAKVFKRDHYTCQECKKERGIVLNAHHIKSWKDHPKLRYEIDNGITLCRECHIKTHKKLNKLDGDK